MSGFNERKYVILTAAESEDIDFSKVMEQDADHLKRSVDETKTIVKYIGSKPSFLHGKDVLTHSQALTELRKAEWIPPVE